MAGADATRRHWRSSQRIAASLLVVWFIVTFGFAFFGRALSGRVFGWPFNFWVAAQGASLVYLALVCGYAYLARRLDEDGGLAEPTDGR